jgi:hypothetical protein
VRCICQLSASASSFPPSEVGYSLAVFDEFPDQEFDQEVVVDVVDPALLDCAPVIVEHSTGGTEESQSMTRAVDGDLVGANIGGEVEGETVGGEEGEVELAVHLQG